MGRLLVGTVALSVTLGVAQLVAPGAATADLGVPESTWAAAQTTYQPGSSNHAFRSDGDLGRAVEVTPAGVVLVNTATGDNRVVLTDASCNIDAALISEDGSTVVVRSGGPGDCQHLGSTI